MPSPHRRRVHADHRCPVILSYVLQNSIQTVAVLVAGRLGPDELSAAAFSLMLAMVLGKCLLAPPVRPLLRSLLQVGALHSAEPPLSTPSAPKLSPAATAPRSPSTSSVACSSSGFCSSPSPSSGLSSNPRFSFSVKNRVSALTSKPSFESSLSALPAT